MMRSDCPRASPTMRCASLCASLSRRCASPCAPPTTRGRARGSRAALFRAAHPPRLALRVAQQALRLALRAADDAVAVARHAFGFFQIIGQRFFQPRGLHEKRLFINDNFTENVSLTVVNQLLQFVNEAKY